MGWDWNVHDWLVVAGELWGVIHDSVLASMLNLLVTLFISAAAIFLLYRYIRGSDATQ